LLAAAVFGGGCESTKTLSPAKQAQNALISAEPRGSHYIGRRYHVEKTRFWGYVRKPGEPWENSRMVLMDEAVSKQPDRLPENPTSGPGFGYDHNREYKLYGRFTGETGYDPNANLILPMFRLESYELINENPGWLFDPNETYNSKRIPKHR